MYSVFLRNMSMKSNLLKFLVCPTCNREFKEKFYEQHEKN